jgi:hypothetical protein
MTTAGAVVKSAQLRITKRSPGYWRVTIDNPPLNVMGPSGLWLSTARSMTTF